MAKVAAAIAAVMLAAMALPGIVLFALVTTPAAPAGALGLDGTPLIMGTSRLTAAQLAAWYAGTGHTSRSTVDGASLMAMYADTAITLGVRADLAVAQAALETGYFEHFPAGAGGNNNFAGIAVYDGQHKGSVFATAADGVAAHLALLREFADPSYHGAPVHTSKPGCCPTIGSLATTWATDASYATQILAVYNAMLASAGLPPDQAGAPGGNAAAVIAFARAQIGKPYEWAAAGPGSFDCSGLTMRAYQAIGILLPHNSAAQFAQARQPIGDPAQLQPGDLLFWAHGSAASIHHVALYVGGGQMIEAYTTGTPVRLAPIRVNSSDYWGATRPLTDPGYRAIGRAA